MLPLSYFQTSLHLFHVMSAIALSTVIFRADHLPQHRLHHLFEPKANNSL